MAFPREGRIKKLNEELEEARSDGALLRASLQQHLFDQTEKRQAVHERGLAETELSRSRDHFRIAISDRILRCGGAFEISDDEQADAFRHADQVQILPDREAKATRFSLLEGVALRELPVKPPAVVPALDTPLDSEPAAGTDETSPEPGQGPRAVDQDESTDEPS
jgi:hypothetical protein